MNVSLLIFILQCGIKMQVLIQNSSTFEFDFQKYQSSWSWARI